MDDKIDYLYRAYMFQADYMRKQFSKKAVGPIRFVVSPKQFSECEVFYPQKEEQIMIAKTLSACEKVIVNHKIKLAALRSQQKSLTQILLSGIVRIDNKQSS